MEVTGTTSDRVCAVPLLLDLRGLAGRRLRGNGPRFQLATKRSYGPVAASLTATTSVPLEPLVGVASLVVRTRVRRDVCVSGFRPIVSTPARGGHRRLKDGLWAGELALTG